MAQIAGFGTVNHKLPKQVTLQNVLPSPGERMRGEETMRDRYVLMLLNALLEGARTVW